MLKKKENNFFGFFCQKPFQKLIILSKEVLNFWTTLVILLKWNFSFVLSGGNPAEPKMTFL